MKRFLMLKTSPANFSFIADVLKMLLGGNIKIKEETEYLFVEYGDAPIEDIKDTILSLEIDLDSLITAYSSSTQEPQQEYELVKELFLKSSHGYYDFKILLLETSNIYNAAEILNFILDRSGVTEEILLAMANCNLNVTQASTELFMHRNTLLYKIDRLYNLSGFDIRTFNDLYILIKLWKA